MIITVNSLRKQLLQLQLLLRQTLMTLKQKEDIQSKISIIQEKLQDNTIEYDITNEQIEHTRNILKNNEGLQDIFRTFWYTCRGTNANANDTLDKGTYVKLFVGNSTVIIAIVIIIIIITTIITTIIMITTSTTTITTITIFTTITTITNITIITNTHYYD